MLMELRGDKSAHSLQARRNRTFPFLREEAQQGHDQDCRAADWKVPGLENRLLKAQLDAASSMVSHIQDRQPSPLPSYSFAPYTAQSYLPSLPRIRSSSQGPAFSSVPRIVLTSTPQRYLSSPHYLPDKVLLLCRVRHIVDMTEELLQCLLCALLGLLLMASVQPASLLRLKGLQLLGAWRCQQIQVVLGKRR